LFQQRSFGWFSLTKSFADKNTNERSSNQSINQSNLRYKKMASYENTPLVINGNGNGNGITPTNSSGSSSGTRHSKNWLLLVAAAVILAAAAFYGGMTAATRNTANAIKDSSSNFSPNHLKVPARAADYNDDYLSVRTNDDLTTTTATIVLLQ
jgi:hypothetical protein